MHGLDTYDYGARQYYSILGRWDRVDPLCEKYYSVSPYAYCENNPVNTIDPDGRKVVFVNGKIGGGSPAAGAQYWNGTNSTFYKEPNNFFVIRMSVLQIEIMDIYLPLHKEEKKVMNMQSLRTPIGCHLCSLTNHLNLFLIVWAELFLWGLKIISRNKVER